MATMTKHLFTQVLIAKGYSVDKNADKPTVLMVGASREEIKKKFIEVKLIAQRYGYKHSIAVKNLEEERDA